MRSFSKLSSALSATAMTALLSALALPGTALANVERGSGYASSDDKITVLHNEYGKEVLVKSEIDVGDLKKMQDTLSDQARQIEELKRNSGSSSSSSSKEIDELKRTIKEQERDLDNLGKQVEELKRNSGSSSSSNNSEISNLKREVSDQDRAMDQLKRTVEELSRKVK
jgi:predicted RNase H-like nuclease (RuvC/YqgF family)